MRIAQLSNGVVLTSSQAHMMFGADALARLIDAETRNWQRLLESSKERAEHPADRSYFDHELSALDDIAKGCRAVIEGKTHQSISTEPLNLPGGLQIQRVEGRWTLKDESGSRLLEGIREALAEDLYRHKTLNDDAFSGHDSLADQVSPHLRVIREALVGFSEGLENEADHDTYKNAECMLGPIDRSCREALRLDRSSAITVHHNDRHRFPFRLEVERQTDEGLLSTRLAQSANGQWLEWPFSDDLVEPPFQPVSDQVALLAEAVLSVRAREMAVEAEADGLGM